MPEVDEVSKLEQLATQLKERAKKGLKKFFLRTVPGEIFEYVRRFVGVISGYAAMWALRAVVMTHPEVAMRIVEKIAEVAYTPPAAWAEFVDSYVEQMTGETIDIESLMRQGVRVGGRQVMEKLGEAFLTPMLGLILPDPPLDFYKGIDTAERFLGVNLQFQLNAWLLHLVGDIVSLGKLKSLKDLPNAISWSYGIGWLSWLILGEPFRITTVEPLKKGLNKIYTPEILSVSEAIKAWFAGFIDQHELQETLLQHGYSPKLIEVLVNLAEKEFSDADLKKLYEERVITEADIDRELAIKGYGPWRRRYLTQLITKDRILKLRDKLLDRAMDLYVKGKITESQLRSYLDLAKYNPQEQKLVIDLLNLEKAKNATPTDAEIKRAYEKGYISYAEAKSMLLDRGWDERWADIILDVLGKEKRS